MELKYHEKYNTFYCECAYVEKEIPKSAGFKWSVNRKVWFTTDPNVAVELLQYADASVVEKIDAVSETRMTAIDESKAIDADIHINCPVGLEYMNFQKAGISYGLKRDNVLISDEMGLGKTIQSIGIINGTSIDGKIIIVCPATMKLVWKSELEKWLVNRGLEIVVWNTKVQPDGNIIITNYALLKKVQEKLKAFKIHIIIGDEIHFCKTKPTTPKQFKKKKKINRSKAFYNIAKRALKRIYLTGTPILNRPAELFYIIKSLGFPMNWAEYMERYADAFVDERGYWNIKGKSNLGELQERLRSLIMIRRLKKDVLTELPDKIRQVIELPDDKLKKAITQEEQYLKEKRATIKEIKRKLKEAKENEDKKVYSEAVKELKEFKSESFGDLARVRHLTALKKVPYVIEHIKALLESTDKIVIFAHHEDVLDGLYKEFKNMSVLLTGKTEEEERFESVNHFQTDPNCKLFIASIKAGGIGITLTSASTVVFVELDWTPSVVSQAEDRCVFEGQKVLTEQGYINIEHVNIGIKVRTHLGNWKKVLNKSTKLEREKLRVDITACGFYECTSVTEDHEIYVYNKISEVFEWIEAINVRPTKHYMVFNGGKCFSVADKVSLQIDIEHKNTFKNNYGVEQKNGRMVILPDEVLLTDDLLYGFGYYIGEGYTAQGYNKSSSVNLAGNITTKKEALVKAITAISKAFGDLKITYYKDKHSLGNSATVYSKELVQQFNKWFGTGAHNKKFPEWVFDLSARQIKILLKGYYRANGYQRNDIQQASTVSNKLIYQLCLINAKLGLTASLHYSDFSKCWSFEYTNSNSDKFRILNKNNCILYPIKKVEIYKPKRKKERVYDLTIEDDASFVVGLSSVHNCHRYGQKNAVLIQHLVINGSIDSKLAKMCVKKQEVITEALDEEPIDILETCGGYEYDLE